MSARLPGLARLSLAAALALSAVVAASTPASAATSVTLTSQDRCGVHLAVAGLPAGKHTAQLTTVSLATGDPVPVLPDEDARAGRRPVLTAVRTFTLGQDVFVPFDAGAVPDDDVRVRVAVLLDRKTLLHVELEVPACGRERPATRRPRPSASAVPPARPPTPSPSATAVQDDTDSPDDAGEDKAVEPDSAASPEASTASPPAPGRTARQPSAQAPADLEPAPVGGAQQSPAAPEPTAAPTAGPPPVAGTGEPGVPSLEPALGGTGTSGYLSLTVPSSAAAPAPVPAPLIAPPVETPPGSSGDEVPALDVLLPPPLDEAGGAGDGDPPALSTPQLVTTMTPDPLADVAPAALALSAAVVGLLMSRRRRSS